MITGVKQRRQAATEPPPSYLLPFAVDQGELQVIVLDGFIRPAQRREDTLMAFLVYSMQWTRALEIDCLYSTGSKACWRRICLGAKTQRDKGDREQILALAYFPPFVFSH